MNAFGERQHAEKFIPMVVRKVLAGETVTIHANAEKTISGSRFYIHARNIASAVLFLLHTGQVREKYNVVGEKEVSNLQIAQNIASILKQKLHYTMVDFHSSRPGHDLRYALDGTKMKDMGWDIPLRFDVSLENTILWIADPANAKWLYGTRQVGSAV
jgi:dTDP-D-glucose 4,6-dehydratase